MNRTDAKPQEGQAPIAEVLYERTVPGIFVRRLNRFLCEAETCGQVEKVHVKNTGRLGELLIPGSPVTLQKAQDPVRKTAYDLISVYKEGLSWVNIDSLAPNALMKRFLAGMDYDVVKPEYTFGNSRFDFYMEKDGRKFLTEVKGCTLASEKEPETGLFPDAPTARGVKHLEELAAAAKEGYRCQIAFVIQMNGICRVLPNNETQPEFGTALERAKKAGVEIAYYPCRVEAGRIRIEGAQKE